MSWLSTTFSSSIGRKVTMSLTGIFLCLFLVVHLLGNLQLLFPEKDLSMLGYKFNEYTKFMTTFLPVKIVSYLLYFSILFHAVQGIMLEFKNRAARPVKYHVNRAGANSHWTSRNMGVLGTVILVFIVVHMASYWAKYKFGEIPMVEYTVEGETVKLKDMFSVVILSFTQWWYVLIYVVSMMALGFHLWHGFKSAFQSLGINHPKYTPIIKSVGYGFSIIVPALFAIIPIVVFIMTLR